MTNHTSAADRDGGSGLYCSPSVKPHVRFVYMLRFTVPYAQLAIAQPLTDQLAGGIGRGAPGPRESVTLVQPLGALVLILVGPQVDLVAATARGLRNDGSEQCPANALAPPVGQHVDQVQEHRAWDNWTGPATRAERAEVVLATFLIRSCVKLMWMAKVASTGFAH